MQAQRLAAPPLAIDSGIDVARARRVVGRELIAFVPPARLAFVLLAVGCVVVAIADATTSAGLVVCVLCCARAAVARRACGSEREAPLRLGHYVLGRPIARGGMGIVYGARHAQLPREAAIKLLRPERCRASDRVRFEREAALTALLRHPNTVRLYDCGPTPDGGFYYAMERLRGADLQTLVEREGPQPPARVAALLAQVCDALSEAHELGIVHRDIKPANLMLCAPGREEDRIKVLDFGLARRGGAPVDEDESRCVLGTPLYVSPEALTQPEDVDAQSDLYAVGAVGYFLLTGSPPFQGESVLEICAHHLHTAPVAPSLRRGAALPPELERLILSCLHKSKAARPASAAALRDALMAARNWWWRGPMNAHRRDPSLHLVAALRSSRKGRRSRPPREAGQLASGAADVGARHDRSHSQRIVLRSERPVVLDRAERIR